MHVKSCGVAIGQVCGSKGKNKGEAKCSATNCIVRLNSDRYILCEINTLRIYNDDQYPIMMSSNKPPCRYGASCYRKNSDHLKSFSHPSEDEEVEQGSTGKQNSCYDATLAF